VRNPIYSTGVGLLLFGAKNRGSGVSGDNGQEGGLQDVWRRMKGWFQGNF